VALVALVAWSAAVVRGGFAYDDREAVEGNPVVEGQLPAWHAFDRDYWHHVGDAGHYRPLATLFLRLDRAVHGEQTRGFHATNTLLHALVAGLVALTGVLLARGAGRAGRHARAAWLGALLFACHPVLADSVAWVSGRTSLLSCLGGALALLGTVGATRDERPGLAFAAAAYGLLLGLLAKEDAVVFALPVLLIAASSARRRVLLASGAGIVLALVLYLALRAYALGSPWPSAPHAPLAGAPLLERLRYAGRALLEAGRSLVAPFGLPPNYGAVPGFAPRATPGGAPSWPLVGWLPWLALVAVGGWVAWIRRGAARVAPLSGAIAALAMLPVLQLVPAGEVYAPRFVYLPLLLGVPAVGALLARLPRAAVPVLLAVCVGGAWQRSAIYSSRGAYAQATLDSVPTDVGAWHTLGLAREEEGDLAGARAAFAEALALDPDAMRPWSSLGRLALAAGDPIAAEAAFARALAAGPRSAIARCNLASLYLADDQPELAEPLYRRATELSPGLLAGWRGLGNALSRLGRADEARAALERARELAPDDAGVRALLRRLAEDAR
jgi:tetratricopeptide (TPR) repeat protein